MPELSASSPTPADPFLLPARPLPAGCALLPLSYSCRFCDPRSPVTSRSNCANDNSTLSVSRPINEIEGDWPVGAAEVIVPVLASTLTTIGVFFPFVYFQGRMRDYFTPLALAIAFALTASLFVAMTLMLAAAGRELVGARARQGSARLVWFRHALGAGLKHPYALLLIAIAAWYGSYQLFDDHVPRGEAFL